MAVESWSAERLASEVAKGWTEQEQRDKVLGLMRGWLARGDGVAVYENHDMGHQAQGARQYLSFGSPAAQIADAEPPVRLPDIGGNIGWRYVLIATVKETPG